MIGARVRRLGPVGRAAAGAALALGCADPDPVTLRCVRFDGDDARAARGVGLRGALFPTGGPLALVRNDTLVREEIRAPPPPVEPPSGTFAEALLDMWDRTDASYVIEPGDLDLGTDALVLLDPFDVPRNAAPDDPAWAALRETWGDAPFVIESGPVGFSCDDDAVLAYARVCGVGCTSHYVIHLRLVEGAWRIQSIADG